PAVAGRRCERGAGADPRRAAPPLRACGPDIGHRGSVPRWRGGVWGGSARVGAGAAGPARGGPVRVTVQSRAGAYFVDIAPGVLASLAEDPLGTGITGRVAVVTDSNVRPLWGDRVRGMLAEAGLDPVLLE